MRLPIHPSRSMPRHKQASLPERVYQGTLCIYRELRNPSSQTLISCRNGKNYVRTLRLRGFVHPNLCILTIVHMHALQIKHVQCKILDCVCSRPVVFQQWQWLCNSSTSSMVSGQRTNIHLGCHAIESGRHPHSFRMLGAGISIVFGSIPPRFDGGRPGTIQPSTFFGDGRIFSPDDFPPGFSATRDVHPSTLPSSEKKLPQGGRGGKALSKRREETPPRCSREETPTLWWREETPPPRWRREETPPRWRREETPPHGGGGKKLLPHDGGGEKKLPLVVKLLETCWCRRTSPGIRLASDAPLELRSKGIGKTRVRWR